MTDRQKIEYLKQFIESSKNVSSELNSNEEEIRMRKKRWITYFRKNISIYIEKRMRFHSFGYQNFSYHLMNEANQYIEVSTRGTGKSLRVIALATARALLYPNSKIGITAVGASQANENFSTAFMQEIVYKYSPLMKYMHDKKMFTTRESDKGYVVTFWNGSVMYFFPCIDSSRGLHVDTLIGEELRLIKKADWDSIAMPMLVTRRAEFRNLPKYVERDDLDEETKVVAITSNRTKGEWFNTMYNNTFSNYFKNTHYQNRVISFDIFLAISHGLKKLSWYVQQKVEMDDLSFRMEVLNETVGGVDGAYYTWDMFRNTQVIPKPFYPPSLEDLATIGKQKKDIKKDDEYRVIFVDFSWVGDYKGHKNDNTVIGYGKLQKRQDKLLRSIEYLRTYSGSEAGNIAMKVKEAFFDYKADYIVIDMRSAGEMLFIDLSKPMEHPYRGESDWNSHGFTVCDETELHFVKPARLEEIRNKVVDPEAIPCVIPITASAELNSSMWLDLAKKLKTKEIQFLIDDLEVENNLCNTKEWLECTSEQKAELLLPYLETRYLINEAVNLTQKWTSGQLKLSEPLNGTKDSIVAVAYFNLFASKLLNKLDKEQQQSTEIDWSKMQCVF